MTKENKATENAKKKADELASEAIGVEKSEKAEVKMEEQEEQKQEIKEIEFKTYDHMVKVNGKYYNTGEKVPLK